MKAWLTTFFLSLLLISNTYAGGSIPSPEFGPTTPHGFYVKGLVGGSTFQAVNITDQTHTNISNGDFTTEQYVMSRNALNFTWLVGLGYFLNAYFSLDATYQRLDLKLRSDNKVIATNVGVFRSSVSDTSGVSDVYLLNFYLHLLPIFHIISRWAPYIGAGLGYSCNKLNEIVSNIGDGGRRTFVQGASRSDFAYQFMVGFYYLLHPHIIFNIQYAFLATGKYEPASGNSILIPNTDTGFFVSKPKIDIYTNQFMMGLILLFNA